jgi:hypothetical protein
MGRVCYPVPEYTPDGKSSERTGSPHGSEVPYVFDNLRYTDRPWSADDQRSHQGPRTAQPCRTGLAADLRRTRRAPIDGDVTVVVDVTCIAFGPFRTAISSRSDNKREQTH